MLVEYKDEMHLQSYSDYHFKRNPDIHPEEVGALLKTINTNKSMTKEDILPILYRAGSDILKYLVTDLFNKIARTGKWP